MSDEQNALALSLIEKLHKDPSTRPEFMKLVKKIKPDAYIPEIDAMQPLEERISHLTNGMNQMVQHLQNEKIDTYREKKKDKLRKDRGFTDDGLAKLEKFMAETSTADYEVAADAFERRQPAPETARPSYQSSRIFDESAKEDQDWLNDPEGTFDKVLWGAFQDVKSGNFK